MEILRDIWQNNPLWIMWATVFAYITFIFLKGVSKARKIESSDDFLVAGRNVGWFFLFCTMGATVIGGGGSIGAIGRTYEWGILMLVVSTGWYIHFIFSGLLVAPKFRNAKLYTVAGYFEHRYGEGPRFLAMLLSLFFSVFIIAAQMAAFGWVLAAALPNLAEQLSGLEFLNATSVLKLAIITGGLLVVIYSTAGGLLAVIYTDVYQFIVLLAGFFITVLLIVPDLAANFASIQQTVPANFLALEGGKGWVFLISTFFAFLLGETFAPGYATRYCIGKNLKHTKYGIAGVGFFLALFFPAVLFVIALYAKLHFPDIEPQMALPTVIRALNNPLVAGLIIGALLSAVMSSADSALNSSTAIFVKDLFERSEKWKKAGDKKILKLARFCSVGVGIAAIGVAVWNPDIIDLLLFTYHVWAPAIIVPVVYGVLSKESSPTLSRQIVVTMLVATVGTLLYRVIPKLSGWMPGIVPEWMVTMQANLDPAVFGVLLATLAFVLQKAWSKTRRPV